MRGNWSSVGVDSKVVPSICNSQFSDSPTNRLRNDEKPSFTHADRSVMPHSARSTGGSCGLTLGGVVVGADGDVDVVGGGVGAVGVGVTGCAEAAVEKAHSRPTTMLSTATPVRHRGGRRPIVRGRMLTAIVRHPRSL
ncbi:hypothetical protein GCM10011609_17160 [Lentzea pudingi]|uniref:Uncharacterized protein n=1 Tax=Lentzea pudingi TaxID=1789439 RepID=A0ABQ2HJ83_9PSEU|nr:hypothetical protein GCM10011609_17160 [Lentzea pudingi]